MLRLTVIGCSGSLPGPKSPASSYLIEAEHQGEIHRVVMDLGSGAIGNLQNHVNPSEIDAVLLSHLHPDHCMDMCGYYVMRKYHPAGPMGPLDVFGPDDAREYLARAYGLGDNENMDEQFAFRKWSAETAKPGQISVGPMQIEVIRVDHPIEAYAIAINHGSKRLVYTGDTGPNPELIDFASGADVLLAEASFIQSANNPEHMHLTGADAGRLANQAGVGRLLLTHIPPWYERETVLIEAQTEFAAAELVHPDAVYEL